jgi:Peptidase M15
MTRLSKNFWLYEFTRSQDASRYDIDNTPTAAAVENLSALVSNVLQPLRDMVNRPININSGYRSPALNKQIKGSPSSQHMKGQAADIECFGISTNILAKIIFDQFQFDQLILEFYNPETGGPNSGWVHVSFKLSGVNRNNALRSYRTKTKRKVKYEKLIFGD